MQLLQRHIRPTEIGSIRPLQLEMPHPVVAANRDLALGAVVIDQLAVSAIAVISADDADRQIDQQRAGDDPALPIPRDSGAE